MSASRVVYGRRLAVTPAWLWLAQRASGLLLGPLVALHVWGLSQNRFLSVLLLAIVSVHGYAGLRRAVSAKARAGLMGAFAIAWCAAVVGFGLLAILGT